MLKPLFKFEAGLLRVEKWILVACVLLMLALAGYTVFYRNVLVSLQTHLATSGPPVTRQDAPAGPDSAGPDSAEPGPAEQVDDSEDAAADDFGGFGGGFGSDEAPAEETAEEGDDFGGFGGGFGSDEAPENDQAAEDEPTDEPTDEQADEAGDFGGFGGGFGDDESDDPSSEGESAEVAPEPDSAESEPAADGPVDVAPAEPRGGPPPEGSMAARTIELIDDVKFHWLDVLLRQLVIICGFLGAMLATRQRSHITVDAVGTLLKGRTEHIVHTVTSLAAAVVCVFLALSGLDLVAIGREFPRQLIPWLKDWHFQLAFPVGWGLLAFHFLMRALESATLATQEPEAAEADEAAADDAVKEVV